MIAGLAFLLVVAAPHESGEQSSPEARRTLQAFARCVADNSPKLATEMLATDFRTKAYDLKMRQLSRNNDTCFKAESTMRSASLLFAGAIAERLLSTDSTPLNARLARAAVQPAPPARSPTDRVVICLVRSVPDDVAKLFATEVASEAESSAASALATAFAYCSRGGPPVESTPAGLRSMLATAAFRTLHTVSMSEARN